jgi:hypothetical protein
VWAVGPYLLSVVLLVVWTAKSVVIADSSYDDPPTWPDDRKVVVSAVEDCQHPGMSAEQTQKASPATQERFGFKTCVGVVIVFLAVVLFVKAGNTRDVVAGCIPLLIGAQLMLPGGRSRAVRVVSMVLAVAAAALVVVSIAVL